MKPISKEGWAFYEYFGQIFPNGQAWGSHAHWPASTVSHAEPLDEEDSNDAYPPDMSQDNVDAVAMANTVLDAAASTASAAITAIATNPSIHDDAMDIDNSSAIELTLAAVGMTSSSKQKHINNPKSPATSPLLSSSLKSSDAASKGPGRVLQAWSYHLLGLHPQWHHTAPEDHCQGLKRRLLLLLSWVSITAFTNSPLLLTKWARLQQKIVIPASLMKQLTLFSQGMTGSLSIKKLLSSSFLVI